MIQTSSPGLDINGRNLKGRQEACLLVKHIEYHHREEL
jgi:hypothetical protein